MLQRERSYWFPSKRHGWGWGPPARWQGWAVLALYAAAVAAVVIRFPPASAPLAFVVLTALASLLLVLVCWITGEPPRWRWGED
jgi:nitrate/nitrite transporter NarK